MSTPAIPPLPSGYTLDQPGKDQPNSQAGAIPPLPPGYTLDQPAKPPADPNLGGTDDRGIMSTLVQDPMEHPFQWMMRLGGTIPNLEEIKGGLKGLAQTAGSALNVGTYIEPERLLAKVLPDSPLRRTVQGNLDREDHAIQWLRGQRPTNGYQRVGEAGESLLEFVAGDELLKGLTESVKLPGLVSKARPFLSRMVERGASVLRQGVLGGAQTAAHGGSGEESAKAAGATAAISAAMHAPGVLLDTARTIISKSMGVSGDLAEKWATKAARAEAAQSAVHAETDKITSDASQAVSQEYVDRPVNVAQRPEAAQAAAAGADGEGKLEAAAQERRVQQRMVRDMGQSAVGEWGRVQKPFVEIGEELGKSPQTARIAGGADVRAAVINAAEERGVRMAEIPSKAFKSLEASKLLSDKSIIQGSRVGGDDLGFNDLTRVRSDLYDAAQTSKDVDVKAALNSAYAEVSAMQQKAAEAAGLGEKYALAKRGYAQFKKEIGSDLMNDFLTAHDFQEQHVARRLAMLSGDSARTQALRDLLKGAGVDTSALDRLVNESGKAQKDLAAVVPGREPSELAGMSDLELKQARLESFASQAKQSGIRAPFKLAMIAYGLVKTVDGIAEGNIRNLMMGPAMAGYGGVSLFTPQIVKSKAFQNWVLREAGVDTANKMLVERMRAAIASMAPKLEKRLQEQRAQRALAQAGGGQ